MGFEEGDKLPFNALCAAIKDLVWDIQKHYERFSIDLRAYGEDTVLQDKNKLSCGADGWDICPDITVKEVNEGLETMPFYDKADWLRGLAESYGLPDGIYSSMQELADYLEFEAYPEMNKLLNQI